MNFLRVRGEKSYLIVNVNDLFRLTEIGDVTGVISAAALEARSHPFGAQTREDAAAGLGVAGVDSADLKTATDDADQPTRDIHVEVSRREDGEKRT